MLLIWDISAVLKNTKQKQNKKRLETEFIGLVA